ncbi:hypothetical protein BDW22DRAFT_952161 [Trametopsis cervina]|nr:hypothetical protein BDW22DRAFT_952161 [Trametopsis cervina]
MMTHSDRQDVGMFRLRPSARLRSHCTYQCDRRSFAATMSILFLRVSSSSRAFMSVVLGSQGPVFLLTLGATRSREYAIYPSIHCENVLLVLSTSVHQYAASHIITYQSRTC